MEQELIIAEILRNKPQGIKLFPKKMNQVIYV